MDKKGEKSEKKQGESKILQSQNVLSQKELLNLIPSESSLTLIDLTGDPEHKQVQTEPIPASEAPLTSGTQMTPATYAAVPENGANSESTIATSDSQSADNVQTGESNSLSGFFSSLNPLSLITSSLRPGGAILSNTKKTVLTSFFVPDQSSIQQGNNTVQLQSALTEPNSFKRDKIIDTMNVIETSVLYELYGRHIC